MLRCGGDAAKIRITCISYDLFLKPRNGPFSSEQFASYFQSRPNYTVEGSQAWYQNEATGVYFVFEFQEEDDEDETYYPAAFNMNYFRPTFFVKEAEPEVSAFITTFDMEVDDPQMEGMGTGDYNPEKFTSGWLHGNEFGYLSILKDHPDVITLPTKTLDQVWSWNFNRARLQESLTDDVFVPSILLISYQGSFLTACVWPDAIPSIIPPVDILLIGRKELAPRKLFRKVEDMAIGYWKDLEPLLERSKSRMEGSAYVLDYQSVPADIVTYIKSLDPVDMGALQRASADQVLDAELVKKYLN